MRQNKVQRLSSKPKQKHDPEGAAWGSLKGKLVYAVGPISKVRLMLIEQGVNSITSSTMLKDVNKAKRALGILA